MVTDQDHIISGTWFMLSDNKKQ